VRLIKSVALQDAETKKFNSIYDLFVAFPALSSSQYACLLPLYQDVPLIKNTSTRTSDSVIGEEMVARGVNFRFQMTQIDSSMALFAPTVLRFTLLSVPEYKDITLGSGYTALNVPVAWYESTTPAVTERRWNMQKVKVLKTKKFKFQSSGGQAAHKHLTFWCGVKGKKKRREDESLIINDYFGPHNGRNYYLAVEVWNVLNETVSNQTSITVDKMSYFKDP